MTMSTVEEVETAVQQLNGYVRFVILLKYLMLSFDWCFKGLSLFHIYTNFV